MKSPKAATAALRPRDGTTARKLLRAAALEFRAAGFAGTDTNRIARRAGFAPQTFYRWFEDKTDIFLAVYRDWEEAERRMVAAWLMRGEPPAALVESVVAHHRRHRVFRRSLRQLSLEDRRVRSARAHSRTRQIWHIRSWAGTAAADPARVAVLLLQLERLADAVAEGELADLGLDEHRAREAMAEIIASWKLRAQ